MCALNSVRMCDGKIIQNLKRLTECQNHQNHKQVMVTHSNVPFFFFFFLFQQTLAHMRTHALFKNETEKTFYTNPVVGVCFAPLLSICFCTKRYFVRYKIIKLDLKTCFRHKQIIRFTLSCVRVSVAFCHHQFCFLPSLLFLMLFNSIFTF